MYSEMNPGGFNTAYPISHYDAQQESDGELDPIVAVKVYLWQQVRKSNTDKGTCRKSQGRGHHVIAAVSQEINTKEK